MSRMHLVDGNPTGLTVWGPLSVRYSWDNRLVIYNPLMCCNIVCECWYPWWRVCVCRILHRSLPPERRHMHVGHQGGVERGYDVGAGGRKVVPRWGRWVSPHSSRGEQRALENLRGHPPVDQRLDVHQWWPPGCVCGGRTGTTRAVLSGVLSGLGAARLLTASWRWLDLRLWGHPVLLGHWPSSSAQHCKCSTIVSRQIHQHSWHHTILCHHHTLYYPSIDWYRHHRTANMMLSRPWYAVRPIPTGITPFSVTNTHSTTPQSIDIGITGRPIWCCPDPGMQCAPSRPARGVPNPPARIMAACITDPVYLATADVVGPSGSEGQSLNSNSKRECRGAI